MTTLPLTPPPLRLVTVLKGPAYGVLQAILVASVALPKHAAADWADIDISLTKVLAGHVVNLEDTGPAFSVQCVARILALAVRAQQEAGLAVFEAGRLLDLRETPNGQLTAFVALPYAPPYPKHAFDTLAWATETVLSLAAAGSSVVSAIAPARAQLDALLQRPNVAKPRGTNSLHFLRAAHQLGIPFDWVIGRVHQCGWGRHQCWLDSSAFDSTSKMGVAMARDKHATAGILRRAGLPASTHELAKTLGDAKRIAARLGYPVVIKPSNLDGGIGVAAGLGDDTQLEHAWNETSKHSTSILVEKHQAGEDFRLIVFDGQLIWAVGRQPAGVTGNGRLSVTDLVDLANQDPRRGYHATASLRPVVLDDEALGLLSEQRLTPVSIPVAGAFVPLRRAANISSGGTPVVVTDHVHPDNRALVERAVKVLMLDLAGVDLIIPDIGQSWRDSGAAIIEINAQPQLVAASQSHLYGQILQARVARQGRIPVLVFVGGTDAARQARLVWDALCATGAKVGLNSGDGLRLGGEVMGQPGLPPYDAGKALLAQRDTAALLLVLDDASILATGLPVDRYDLLVVVESPHADTDTVARIDQVLALILPHCARAIVSTSARTLAAIPPRQLPVPADSVAFEPVESLADRVSAWVLRELPPESPT